MQPRKGGQAAAHRIRPLQFWRDMHGEYKQYNIRYFNGGLSDSMQRRAFLVYGPGKQKPQRGDKRIKRCYQ